jgi:hypothetical protein
MIFRQSGLRTHSQSQKSVIPTHRARAREFNTLLHSPGHRASRGSHKSFKDADLFVLNDIRNMLRLILFRVSLVIMAFAQFVQGCNVFQFTICQFDSMKNDFHDDFPVISIVIDCMLSHQFSNIPKCGIRKYQEMHCYRSSNATFWRYFSRRSEHRERFWNQNIKKMFRIGENTWENHSVTPWRSNRWNPSSFERIQTNLL